MKTIITSIALASSIALTGCAGSDEPTSYETITATSTATATETSTATATVTETEEAYDPPAEETTSDDLTIGQASLQIAWNNQSESEQDDFCAGYSLAPQETADLFYEMLDSDTQSMLTRSEAKTFFDSECLDQN